MASLTERLAIIITGEAVSAVNAFKETGAAAEAAGEKISVTQKATGAFGSLAGAAAGAIGIASAAVAVDKLVGSFAHATEQVRSFQLVSGATAGDASNLVAAFNVLGVDSDAAGTAVFRLAHNLDGQNKKLAAFGVQVATAKDGTVDLTGTFLNIADAIAKVGPGAQADAIAFAAFGRQAKTLLPVLLEGRDGLKGFFDQAQRQGLQFDQGQIDKGHQFAIATKEAEDAVKGLGVQLGEGLAPALTEATKGLTSFIEEANKLARPVGGISGALDDVLKSAKQFAGIGAILDLLHGDFGKIIGDTPILGTGIDLLHGHYRQALGSIVPFLGEHKKATTDSATATNDLADKAAKAADALAKEDAAAKAAADAIKGYNTAFDAAANAQDTFDKASRSVITATRDEDRARADLNKLQQQGAVDAQAVAAAEKNVAAASKATTDAQKAEATATQRVADAQQAVIDAQVALEKVKQGASAEEIARAQLGSGKAQRDAQRAVLALADATDKKNSIVTVGLVGAGQQVGTARDQIQADLDLADAQDNVTLAAFDAQDAQKNLTDVLNKGKDGSDDFKKAQDDLTQKQKDLTQAIQDQADAHQNVIDKQQAEIDQGDALKKAQADDPDFAQKLADAQQKVADAHQNTADQITAEAKALEALNLSEGALVTARINRTNALPPVPANFVGPALDRPTTSSSFGAGVVVTGNVNVQVDGRTIATVTQNELAAAAKRNGLS